MVAVKKQQQKDLRLDCLRCFCGARHQKLKAEKPRPKGCSKLDLNWLRAMLAARPTAQQTELADLLGVSQATVWLGIKRLKLTHKKTTSMGNYL